MARDYKHRAVAKQSKRRQPVAGWKWLLSIILLVGFGYFLYSLYDVTPVKKATINSKKTQVKADKVTTKGPRFDFYTLLPEKEVIVKDHEIKTRTRQERVGRAKAVKYLLQAGSFKSYKQADSLKAQLALMGVESRIEKAKIGNVVWNRIKIGPFSSMTVVDRLRKRLKQNKIDSVVTETKG